MQMSIHFVNKNLSDSLSITLKSSHIIISSIHTCAQCSEVCHIHMYQCKFYQQLIDGALAQIFTCVPCGICLDKESYVQHNNKFHSINAKASFQCSKCAKVFSRLWTNVCHMVKLRTLYYISLPP